MRNKLGLFLRYSIPDREDLMLGGIRYSELKYVISQICDSFANDDFKLNNIGIINDENMVNYLFLSPIGTGFDISNDIERYHSYDILQQWPIGLEHLISLAINNKLVLTHEDIVKSIINTSTNTIFNYLLADIDTVNFKVRKTKSFRHAFKNGSRFIEMQASFISIGTLLVDYPEKDFSKYKNRKYDLLKIIKNLNHEEEFLYGVKEILNGNEINGENLFLPFGIYYQGIPYSIYKDAGDMKDAYFYLISYIKSLNLNLEEDIKIDNLFNRFLNILDLYDNGYVEEDRKSVDTEYFINTLKTLYNNFRDYYNEAYNIEELTELHKIIYDDVITKIDKSDAYHLSKLEKFSIDYNLYNEFGNSSFKNTISLISVVKNNNKKDLILEYVYRQDNFIYNYIPFIINSYEYESQIKVGFLINDLKSNLKNMNIDKVLSQIEKEIQNQKDGSGKRDIDIILKYKKIINKYISFSNTYNKVLSIYYEKYGTKISDGMNYHDKLEKYLEIIYLYYQSVVYSDILISSKYISECPNNDESFGISYFNCTSFIGKLFDDTDTKIDLSDLVYINSYVNPYIVQQYKYWFENYIKSKKPIYLKKSDLKLIEKLYDKGEIRNNLLNSVENVLLEFYTNVSKTVINNRNFNFKNYKNLKNLFYKNINNLIISKKLSNTNFNIIENNNNLSL